MFPVLGTCSFICQCTSTRRQQRELFGLRVKLPLVTSQTKNPKVEAIPLSTLAKDTTSELVHLSSQYPFNAERYARKL